MVVEVGSGWCLGVGFFGEFGVGEKRGRLVRG